MTHCLKQSVIKHSYVSSNNETHEIEAIDNIDNSLTSISDLTLRELFAHIKALDGELFVVAIVRNWEKTLEF